MVKGIPLAYGLALVCTYMHSAQAAEPITSRQAFQKLERTIQAGDVESIRVLRISYGRMYELPITAQDFDRDAEPTCELKLDGSKRQVLVDVLKQTSVRGPVIGGLDRHWGVKIFNRSGTQLSALYLSLHWNNGTADSELDGMRATINDKLISWLESEFPLDKTCK